MGMGWNNTTDLASASRFAGAPQGTQLVLVFRIVANTLPDFAESARRNSITNENGLNRRLARFLSRRFFTEELPYTAQPESMEDESKGNSPAVDICVFSCLDDTAEDLPKVAVLEGKCLTSNADKRRRREYVHGISRSGSPCGGIQRFKMAVHGHKMTCGTALVGYMQTDDFFTWHDRINAWIKALAAEEGHCPPWSEDETLSNPVENAGVATCESMICRKDDCLPLIHIWVDLTGSPGRGDPSRPRMATGPRERSNGRIRKC